MEEKMKNLLSATYLSGAAEALNKCHELPEEEALFMLNTLKKVRTDFIGRAESDGYSNVVEEIETAKHKALEVYKEHEVPFDKNTPISEFLTPIPSLATTPQLFPSTSSNSSLPSSSNSSLPTSSNSSLPTSISTSISTSLPTQTSTSISTPSLSTPSLSTPSLSTPSLSESIQSLQPPPQPYTPTPNQLGGKRRKTKRTKRKNRKTKRRS